MKTPMELLDDAISFAGRVGRGVKAVATPATVFPAALPQNQSKKSHKRGRILVAVGLVVAYSVYFNFLGVKDKENNGNGTMAYVQCQEYVKQYLKAPSTAKFSDLSETEIHWKKGSDKYGVIGWVDSQNGFGAMLRTKYICVATDRGNDQWDFEQLVTNDGSN